MLSFHVHLKTVSRARAEETCIGEKVFKLKMESKKSVLCTKPMMTFHFFLYICSGDHRSSLKKSGIEKFLDSNSLSNKALPLEVCNHLKAVGVLSARP